MILTIYLFNQRELKPHFSFLIEKQKAFIEEATAPQDQPIRGNLNRSTALNRSVAKGIDMTLLETPEYAGLPVPIQGSDRE